MRMSPEAGAYERSTNSRLGCDLDQHAGAGQGSHLDQSGGEADVAEDLAEGAADFAPGPCVEQIDAGGEHVGQGGVDAQQGLVEIGQGLAGLVLGLARADQPAVMIVGRGALARRGADANGGGLAEQVADRAAVRGVRAGLLEPTWRTPKPGAGCHQLGPKDIQ